MWHAPRSVSPSPLTEDLHVDPIRVLDVQTGIGVVERGHATRGQIARRGFLGEAGHANGKVIDNSRRALTVEGDQRPAVTDTEDSEPLVLADERETEQLLIEIGGTLQVRHLNADMVDGCSLEFDVLLALAAVLLAANTARP